MAAIEDGDGSQADGLLGQDEQMVKGDEEHSIDNKLALIRSEQQMLKKLKKSQVLKRNGETINPASCAKLMYAM